MKKIFLTVIISIFAMFGCSLNSRDEIMKNRFNEIKMFYESPHQLKKMFDKDEGVITEESTKGHLPKDFFLFIDDTSGNNKEGTKTRFVATHVRFAWVIKDNTYIITTLPLEKIETRLVEKIEAPTVSFFLDEIAAYSAFNDLIWSLEWKGIRGDLGRIINNYFGPHETLSKYLTCAVFTIRSEDWPFNLAINQK